MSTAYLELNTSDPIVARDGRPFGVDQGNRMRGLPWPYPSVVAGSYRTALVKATGGDFTGDTPAKLMTLAVAGVFPVAAGELYLPAPNDCVWDEKANTVHRAAPFELKDGEGGDFPGTVRPVTHDADDDFKPKPVPAWWPLAKYAAWLTGSETKFTAEFFAESFLLPPKSEDRTQVEMNPNAGSVEEGKLFTTSGLRLAHLPRFGVSTGEKRFDKKFAEITLAARVETGDRDASRLGLLHPLGGERRLAHWSPNGSADLWKCPDAVTAALGTAKHVRMVLATPAVFTHGWRPGWLNDNLEGTPPDCGLRLKLVGVSIPRWRAVSGWSLAPPRGPKPIKRIVPAGGVYFFETVGSDSAASLEARWLQPVSDAEQGRLDGFGLAAWGTW